MNGSHDSYGRGNRPASTKNVVSNATDVLRDIAEMAELQVRLFATDLKTTARQSAIHIAVLLLGASCLLGVMPVLLMGIAELLAAKFELSRSLSLLGSAAGGLVVAGIVICIGCLGLRRGLTQLSGSNEELARNLAWIKKTLRRNETPKSSNS